MGTQYKHYLLPEPRSFQPSLEVFTKFIHELVRQRWLPDWKRAIYAQQKYLEFLDPSEFSDEDIAEFVKRGDVCWDKGVDFKTLEKDIQEDFFVCFGALNWAQSKFRYPLNIQRNDEESWLDIGFSFVKDFAFDRGASGDCIDSTFWEGIRGISKTRCRCGLELRHEVKRAGLEEERIHRFCPNCREEFDPANLTVSANGLWNYRAWKIRGGFIYRFAIIVDVDKCIPGTVTDYDPNVDLM